MNISQKKLQKLQNTWINNDVYRFFSGNRTPLSVPDCKTFFFSSGCKIKSNSWLNFGSEPNFTYAAYRYPKHSCQEIKWTTLGAVTAKPGSQISVTITQERQLFCPYMFPIRAVGQSVYPTKVGVGIFILRTLRILTRPQNFSSLANLYSGNWNNIPESHNISLSKIIKKIYTTKLEPWNHNFFNN